MVLPSLVLLDLVGGAPRGVRICVPPVRRVCTVLVRMYVLLDTEVSDSCTIHTLGSPVHHTGIRTARFLENVSNRYGLVGADILGRWCELLMPLVSRHLCWVHHLVALEQLVRWGQNLERPKRCCDLHVLIPACIVCLHSFAELHQETKNSTMSCCWLSEHGPSCRCSFEMARATLDKRHEVHSFIPGRNNILPAGILYCAGASIIITGSYSVICCDG